MDIATVERLLIYHLGEGVTTPVAVLPGDLEAFGEVSRFESNNSHDFRAAYQALEDSRASANPDRDIDARWGVRMRTRTGVNTGEVVQRRLLVCRQFS